MQRYTLQGIADDLESGAQIAVYVAQYNTVANLIHQIKDYTDETYTQVRSSESRIYHESGGTVSLYTNTVQFRGASLEVAVVPHGTAADFIGVYIHGVEIIEY